MSSVKPNSFSHLRLLFLGHLQINTQMKLVVDISLKLQHLEANDNILTCFGSDHLFKGENKYVFRFLHKDEFETTTLNQKHPSPISFKVILSCSAPPANILPAEHFGWDRGLP